MRVDHPTDGAEGARSPDPDEPPSTRTKASIHPTGSSPRPSEKLHKLFRGNDGRYFGAYSVIG